MILFGAGIKKGGCSTNVVSLQSHGGKGVVEGKEGEGKVFACSPYRKRSVTMLEIRLIMDSPVEEILAFKTCCGLKAFDQNLEVLVRNIGSEPTSVRGYFDLKGGYGSHRMDAVIPPEGVFVGPGDVKALYCYMDETLWENSAQVILYDSNGTAYHVEITHKR